MESIQLASNSAVPVLAALLGATVSTTISHFFTKKRDAAGEARQEARDRRQAAEYEERLYEQRNEAKEDREEQQRISAVKSYYTAFLSTISPTGISYDTYRGMTIARRLFALEVQPLNTEAAKLSKKIHDASATVRVAEHKNHGSRDHALDIAVSFLVAHQDDIFDALMEWAATYDTRKLRSELDKLTAIAEQMNDLRPPPPLVSTVETGNPRRSGNATVIA